MLFNCTEPHSQSGVGGHLCDHLHVPQLRLLGALLDLLGLGLQLHLLWNVCVVRRRECVMRVPQRGGAGGDVRPVRVRVWRRGRPRVRGIRRGGEIRVLAGRVGGVAGGGAFRAVGVVAVLGRRGGVLIHRALHGWVGGQLAGLALHGGVSVADCLGVRDGVGGEPVSHAHLLGHLVHHALGAVEVAPPLLGVALGLGHLYLSCLRLLQHALASPGGHHLECDDGRQLLPAHGDVHGRQHGPPTVAHARVRPTDLVRYETEHVVVVGVLGHAHPALLLPQHVADRRKHRPAGGAAQQRGGVCRGGDCPRDVSYVGVGGLQRVHGRHGDRALWQRSCCLYTVCIHDACSAPSARPSGRGANSGPLHSGGLLSSFRLHVFQLLRSPADTPHLCSATTATASPALLSLRSWTHAHEACPVGAAHHGGVSRAAHEIGPVVRTVDHVVLVQQTHDVVVHALLGRVAGQPIHVIGDVAVGIVVEEDLSGLKAAFSGCKEEWSLLLETTSQQINVNRCSKIHTPC